MEWYQLAVVFAAAFIATYCLVPVAKHIAWVIGAIDMPTSRRVNKKPVPRCGGIAMYLGTCAAFLVYAICCNVFGWHIQDLYVTSSGINNYLLFAGVTLMFAVGLVDDITQLSAGVKLIWQIIACCIVVAAGISIGSIRLFSETDYIMLGWLDYPISVLVLVAFANIINLIDGLDGLASGVVAIIMGAMLYLVLQRGSFTLALVCVAIIAVCLAFLRYNFFPASIFMGDSGALFLGLIVGIVSITGVVRTQSIVVLFVPILIAGLPVLDTLTSIVRRLRAHKRVGEADLGHIHHRLMRAGLSQKRSVALLWASSAVLAVLGCAIENLSGPVVGVILLIAFVAIFYVIWHFGLFKPTLRHYYDNRGKRGARVNAVDAAYARGEGEDEAAGTPGVAAGAGAGAGAGEPAAASRGEVRHG